MKSLGMREYSVRRIFIIESAMMGTVGILFGWILGYLLCYGWSPITIFNPLTGATVPLQIYYSPMHYIASGGDFNSVLRGRRLLPGAQSHAGASGRDYPGRVLSEIALQVVGLVRRVQGVISHTLVDGIDLSVAKGEFLAITGPSGSRKIIVALFAWLARCADRRRGHHLRPANVQIIGNGGAPMSA